MKVFVFLVTLFSFSVSLQASDDVVVIDQGIESGDRNGRTCSVTLIDHGRGNIVEYGSGYRYTDFTITKQTDETVKGIYENEAPGAGGFSFCDYTPAEKTSVTIKVFTQERRAEIRGKNCYERVFLCKGTGIYKCEKFSLTCEEE